MKQLEQMSAGLLAATVICLTAEAAQPSAPVAVLDFTVPADASNRWHWAESGVADLLQIELERLGLLTLDRDLVHAVLNEQRLAAQGMTAKDFLTLSSLLNARHLITGQVTTLAENRIQVEASAFSVEAIETIVTGAGNGAFPEELQSVLESVARKLAEKLKAEGSAGSGSGSPGYAPKPESLIMFYRGLNACARGQAELGVAWFMNSSSLDPQFGAPLLWETKAYEMAGLAEHAAIRRQETAPILTRLGIEVAKQAGVNAHGTKPVLAVLTPVMTARETASRAEEVAALAMVLKQSLLAAKQVRLFAFENIGEAVAEQDLKLSSFFAGQQAPRYGRWLMADGLLFCRVSESELGQATAELAVINPLTATVQLRLQRAGPRGELEAVLANAARKLIGDWTSQRTPTPVATPNPLPEGDEGQQVDREMRPIYASLATALRQVRREPSRSEFHQALANALGATGRHRQAAMEIERTIRTLDIRAPGADQTFFGVHRWLFWEGGGSPLGGAIGLVDKALINEFIQRLLTVYPQSLAAGCLHYNLAIDNWHAGNWKEAVDHAARARRIIEPRPAKGELDLELIGAAYFLEGSSLRRSGNSEEALAVLKRGQTFSKEFRVRDFALPLGPFIGGPAGSERVFGYGGDAPGVRTRIEEELVLLEPKRVSPTLKPDAKETPSAADSTFSDEQNWLARAQHLTAETNAPAETWLKRAQFCFDKQRYREALICYRNAIAQEIPPAQCSSLLMTMVEAALETDFAHAQDEVVQCSRNLGIPVVVPTWLEWFNAGRKYQAGRQYDFDKAAVCYRLALEFLEHPERSGSHHLEKDAGSDRVALRWGPGLGEADFQWSVNYDSRWHSTAFYLAQCLIETGHKEDAAQWLRRIALKLGGDNTGLLIHGVSWHGASYQTVPLGVRAAEMLKQLHLDHDPENERPLLGAANPFKVLPPRGRHARPLPEPPPLATPDPVVMRALTNLLAEVAQLPRQRQPHPRLQEFVQHYGHDAVPPLLSLLPQAGERWDESTLAWMLEQTAEKADAPYLVAACPRHFALIRVAKKLDLEATADVVAAEWWAQATATFPSPSLVHAILDARLRPIYPLVLALVAEKGINHHTTIFALEGVVQEEKSPELEAAFRDALASCLRIKLAGKDFYEMPRICQVALRQGVPEGIEGLLESVPRDQILQHVRPSVDLAANNDEALRMLRENLSKWEWDAQRKKFTLPTADAAQRKNPAAR